MHFMDSLVLQHLYNTAEVNCVHQYLLVCGGPFIGCSVTWKYIFNRSLYSEIGTRIKM